MHRYIGIHIQCIYIYIYIYIYTHMCIHIVLHSYMTVPSILITHLLNIYYTQATVLGIRL